jgi:hypothetical protein
MRFYIVETLQSSSGQFMGSVIPAFSTIGDARDAAQRQANYYGVITRAVLVEGREGMFSYTVVPDQQLTMADYFYPVII